MFRVSCLVLALLASSPAAAGKLDKLTEAELDHYRALRVFMDEDEEKAWLKLKTTEERDAWLKAENLWDKFYALPPEVREQIVGGKVERGYTRDMVYMTWGAPFQKNRLTGRPAGRSELLVYRFEIDKDGYANPIATKRGDYKAEGHYQMELVVDDDVVTEITQQDGWTQ
jgi:hypothetical protein